MRAFPIIIREKGKELCTRERESADMSKKNYVVVAGPPEPCPRCGAPMQIREHTEITAKHLAQPYYYTRWFRCMNPRCKTTLVMREEYKVTRAPAPESHRKPVILDADTLPWGEAS